MTRIHHANIRTADPVQSVAFYRILGLEHTGTLSMGPGYTLLYMTDGDGLALELVANDTTDPAYDRSAGSGHLAFEVDDLDATLTALRDAHGTEPESAPMHPGGREDLNKVAFVRDPDGVRLELLQSAWPIPADALPTELQTLGSQS
jgi:catechol 2,3-dioxygenase-like lactoylglutathione lyase family enzyme